MFFVIVTSRSVAVNFNWFSFAQNKTFARIGNVVLVEITF